eukprot:351884-Chlamydomonas_euryale.AAC.2
MSQLQSSKRIAACRYMADMWKRDLGRKGALVQPTAQAPVACMRCSILAHPAHPPSQYSLDESTGLIDYEALHKVWGQSVHTGEHAAGCPSLKACDVQQGAYCACASLTFALPVHMCPFSL